jgi:hypothetical protein
MNTSRRMLPAFVGVVTSLVLVLSASASAAPITVNLRVEGSTKTLYEGPVSTEGETFETASSKGPHPCDYAENGHSENEKHEVFTNGGPPAGTPTSALHHAALSASLAFNAEWSTTYGDFLVTQVGPDVNQSEEPFSYWGLYVNDLYAPVGGCQYALAPGNEVLWAYGPGFTHVLSLSAPQTVNVGVGFTVHVTDARTGSPVSGAVIGEDVGGTTTPISASQTNAEGNATVTFSRAGTVTLKATAPESVRSNGLAVSVGYDICPASTVGCGGIAPAVPFPTVPVAPDVAKVAGVKNGHVYSRRSAPRLLAGVVEVPIGGTLRQVRISLQRRYRGRCFDFSGSRESFIRTKKCGSATFFSVGGSESFSYLLPASLPKGSYVFDIEGIDSTGQATKLVNGISHVVFQVK